MCGSGREPEWERFVLIVGGELGGQAEGLTEVSLDELPLPHRRQFCFRYTILELNTAVKPWMFEYLFQRGFDLMRSGKSGKIVLNWD